MNLWLKHLGLGPVVSSCPIRWTGWTFAVVVLWWLYHKHFCSFVLWSLLVLLSLIRMDYGAFWQWNIFVRWLRISASRHHPRWMMLVGPMMLNRWHHHCQREQFPCGCVTYVAVMVQRSRQSWMAVAVAAVHPVLLYSWRHWSCTHRTGAVRVWYAVRMKTPPCSGWLQSAML